MSCEELQEEEREILQSIFEGDENFKAVDSNSFQYTVYSATSSDKTVAVRIHWPSQARILFPLLIFDLNYFWKQDLLQKI